jgi:hypothetical protein
MVFFFVFVLFVGLVALTTSSIFTLFYGMVMLTVTLFFVTIFLRDPVKGRDLDWMVSRATWVVYGLISGWIAHTIGVNIVLGFFLGVVAGFLAPVIGFVIAMMFSKN